MAFEGWVGEEQDTVQWGDELLLLAGLLLRSNICNSQPEHREMDSCCSFSSSSKFEFTTHRVIVTSIVQRSGGDTVLLHSNQTHSQVSRWSSSSMLAKTCDNINFVKLSRRDALPWKLLRQYVLSWC